MLKTQRVGIGSDRGKLELLRSGETLGLLQKVRRRDLPEGSGETWAFTPGAYAWSDSRGGCEFYPSGARAMISGDLAAVLEQIEKGGDAICQGNQTTGNSRGTGSDKAMRTRAGARRSRAGGAGAA